MQQFWKSVKIWQSYREFKGGNCFETQCSYENENVTLLRRRYLPNRSSLSSRRASRLSLRNCFSISWLILFCSCVSSLMQHAIAAEATVIDNTTQHSRRSLSLDAFRPPNLFQSACASTTNSTWSCSLLSRDGRVAALSMLCCCQLVSHHVSPVGECHCHTPVIHVIHRKHAKPRTRSLAATV